MLPTIEREKAKRTIEAIIEYSRKTYAKPKAEVEKELRVKTNSVEKKEKPKSNIPVKKEPAQNQHQYLQSIIKRIGENYGFISTQEKQVFGGVGFVDVALEKDNLKIACEVANTNTVNYEFQNIQKCLSSDFKRW